LEPPSKRKQLELDQNTSVGYEGRVNAVESYVGAGEHAESKRKASHIVTFTVVRSRETLPRARVLMSPPGVSKILRTRPLDGSV